VRLKLKNCILQRTQSHPQQPHVGIYDVFYTRTPMCSGHSEHIIMGILWLPNKSGKVMKYEAKKKDVNYLFLDVKH